MPDDQQQDFGSIKGDDVGFFRQIGNCLNDIREARKVGDDELYKRVAIGLSLDMDGFYDKTARSEKETIDKQFKHGNLNKWGYASKLNVILIRLIQRCGFLPIKEDKGLIEDDDINGKIQRKDS